MSPDDLPTLADVVLRLVDVCERVAVPYAIGGAVATSFWCVPRTTQDADCLVAVPAVGYQRLADALNASGFEIDQASGPRPVTVVARLEPPAIRELEELIATYEADRPAHRAESGA